ncbi:hypothetical protein TBLA_0D03130 [Henningerozyma blattae CBS 6284]|uniref:Nucleolar complex-associated protein 3 n=1 Tax=Henningerozyma blattae (strain ATCC 34711 / CBS 6284 / DSM 70876 / NBRC 10599 / NRRL Y-10934 / UCD 77-7) TaxID=1071380 RepID=I2H361_HENB6|nr:hypothetical protein TBLA_0D03130 [Tetrapisispora blattae CBS 6284]CCH60813.1 hypothetical protein TBLA_0D03130 [Tetrapisispora blattae CBS 6284]
MARVKRSQSKIQQRTSKKRKYEDSLLENGTFNDIGEVDAAAMEILGQEESSSRSKSKKENKWDNELQDYELKPRTLKNYDNEEDLVEGLPIKIGGKIERKLHKKENKLHGNEQGEDSNEDNIESAKGQKEDQLQDDDEEEENPDTEEKIIELKELIAELVEKIMTEPEDNVAALGRLCKMAGSKNPNTCKFSTLALVPVFKSIIPGYKIRPLTELEKKEKVSKEVAKLRHFEQSLIIHYKTYLDLLVKFSRVANNDSPIKVAIGNLAVQAANQIAFNASHFNFKTEVLTLLIRRIAKPNLSADPTAAQTIKTLENLMVDDDEGAISVDIVRIFSKILKVRKYSIDESVLNILLSLDVLKDYDPNTKNNEEEIRIKQRKKDRVHLSKKQRKARKEMKEIEEEMRKAELAVSAEEREHNQAEILKLVLSLYLNILREGSAVLLAPVLEGLAKFGNMANFDLLGDFLEVLKEIIRDTDLALLSPIEIRKFLLCIVSAFSLVSNNNAMKINIDLSVFVEALYSILPMIALDSDIELSYKSLRFADPLGIEITKPAVDVSTKAELLLKALDHIFFRSKSGTKERATAFTKRLYMLMLHTPEKTSMAILKFIDKLMNRYPEIRGLYSTEDCIGNGIFHLESNSISRCNIDAATLWENSLLWNHYSSVVVKGVNALSNRSKDSNR